MTKKKLLKLSLITLIIGLCVLAIAYFFFHFVTDSGITFKWHPEAGKEYSKHLWAPEIHEIGGRWYVLFAASGSSDNVWDIDCHIIMCEGDDPYNAPWVDIGKFSDCEGDGFSFRGFSLDMTYFEHNGRHYLIWAEIIGDSSLFMAEITPENPQKLINKPILLTKPEYDWEKVVFRVNEGASVLKTQEKIYVFFSASGTGSEYCMGRLEADTDADLMNPASWKKLDSPVLQTSDLTGESGPGHNSFVKDENGNVKELAWYKGGIYGKAIEKICEELALAAKVAENDVQKRALNLLIKYYETGDLKLWDDFNVEWVKDTLGTVDFINGFVEDYNDPLGRKGAWEGYVHIKDHAASVRTSALSANAQWFEDNSPIDDRFKKKECKGVSAKVVNVVCITGDAYPATAIGINLPNADWIRKMYGSKSVTIANITKAYDLAAEESPMNTLDEFAYDEAEKEMARKWGSFTSDIHTDLHECLGHGSGQLLPGVSTTAMGEYASTLEEARADLFGLYYTADPKMQELGIIPDKDAYKAEYASYIRNGLMVQFNRIELGKPNTEAHMQNRKLIAEWCYENGKKDNVIEKKVRDGKTYFVINDYVKLRALFAELLAEIQRIKSEGDYEAGKALVEKYAVNIDPAIHKEVLERYEALNLKPYGGFINPDIVPVVEDGKVVDYQVVYNDDYLEQQLYYGKKYSTLN